MREKSSLLDASLEQREGCGRIPGMVDRSSLNPDAKALEDAFFARENAKLLDQLRARTESTQRREALRSAMGTVDEAVLDRL